MEEVRRSEGMAQFGASIASLRSSSSSLSTHSTLQRKWGNTNPVGVLSSSSVMLRTLPVPTIFLSLHAKEKRCSFQPCWACSILTTISLIPWRANLYHTLVPAAGADDCICLVKEWFSLVFSLKQWYFVFIGHSSLISINLPGLCLRGLLTWGLRAEAREG